MSLKCKVKRMHGNLPGAETGEGDGAETMNAAHEGRSDCRSCLLLLEVGEELQMVMTAPLLLLAPGAEKKTWLLLGRWGRDMDDGINRWCRDETGRHPGFFAATSTAPEKLPDRGGESGGDGEKPKRKKERTRLWFSCCSGDRGKMCFGFENGDGKGKCGR
ncbi:hypothetical protein H0E87_031250 [Populus deltoides]|uniref:Uncharacterized protein n=1 Tax=Populus deltoides TaxID=3696 RepID=A0A8T2WKX1_POPDE|nr:hypothetical protein H0E87_031250 [Populus deltoides]